MDREELRSLYRRVRRSTEALAEPLEIEDCVVQTMPDVSPTKWHLAHTSWFFETFVLQRAMTGYHAMDERYAFLFNSYYHTPGGAYPRPRRGLLSRPTVAEVLEYRLHVDRWMEKLFSETREDLFAEYAFVVELGLNHEEQHQELLLTDIKHVLASNPLEPRYGEQRLGPEGAELPLGWISFDGGMVEIGHAGAGFAFDNERPRHRTYLHPFELANRLASNGDFVGFIEDGGYARPELWLSDGWDAVQRNGWQAPLYWQKADGRWRVMTLSGPRGVQPREPVSHVSYYEADAFARWAKARLPLEQEWEWAASRFPVAGNFVESGLLHPAAPTEPLPPGRPAQLFGDVWEWTGSAYLPYPGFEPFRGALGEYNGKFMCNQMVLRGGSCASPVRHLRPSYRNFFPPEARWQFMGIRLAR